MTSSPIDSDTTGRVDRVIDVERVSVNDNDNDNDNFSAGPRVAFHATLSRSAPTAHR